MISGITDLDVIHRLDHATNSLECAIEDAKRAAAYAVEFKRHRHIEELTRVLASSARDLIELVDELLQQRE